VPRAQIEDEEQYEALRREGESKEKAARIANSSRSATGRKGGESGSSEDWTKAELRTRAAEIGLEGRSSMDEDVLVKALRDH
jgi:hypothetical protein